MPHWLQLLIAAATAVASWRWVIRPLRRAWRELLKLLGQVRDSSSGVQEMALEIKGLAGSVIRLVVAIVEDHQALREEHAELRERQSDQAELLVDLDADVRRMERKLDDPD